ncbi:MAG: hypothetical protein GY771_17570 [bacterium]|nr:hypothetical protein [bacterium]
MLLKRTLLTSALLLLFILIIAACCPIPVPRESMRWPGCEFTIVNEYGQPLADCELTLYFWSYPYRTFEEELILLSDADGGIAIAEETFDETVMPLMMHGVPEYHWSYHVYKEGYITVAGGIVYTDESEVIPVLITMREGESVYFDSFEDFKLNLIGMPRSDDGHTEGPVEIKVMEEPVEEPIEAGE